MSSPFKKPDKKKDLFSWYLEMGLVLFVSILGILIASVVIGLIIKIVECRI